MSYEKEWTILIYANGNNELEPEMSNIFYDIENNVDMLNNVNVVLQLSRASYDELKILRPNYQFTDNNLRWTNTRRFYYNNNHFELAKVMGNINMADPNELYDFLVWATNTFPAKRYLLSLGGHAYQFVGMLADYSQDKPYLAGFPQLAQIIDKACENQKINIDILVLDTCYSSSFEIIYEFGKNPENLIKYLFTYIGGAPIAGFLYSKIISIIENHYNIPTEAILANLVENSCNEDISLIGYKLDHKLMELYKKLFSNIAHSYLLSNQSKHQPLDPYQILTVEDITYPWSIFLSYLAKTIPLSIIKMTQNNSERENLLPIHVLYTKIKDTNRQETYSRLSFTKDNYWYHIVCDLPLSHTVEYTNQTMGPLEISERLLSTTILASNCSLLDSDVNTIVKKIIKLKSWKLQ